MGHPMCDPPAEGYPTPAVEYPTVEQIVALYDKHNAISDHCWHPLLAIPSGRYCLCPMAILACDKAAGETGDLLKGDKALFANTTCMDSTGERVAAFLGLPLPYVEGFVFGFDSGVGRTPTTGNDEYKAGYNLGVRVNMALDERLTYGNVSGSGPKANA